MKRTQSSNGKVKRFAQVPYDLAAMVRDKKLKLVDLHTYVVLRDWERNNQVKVSCESLGERIGRWPKAVRNSLRRLEGAEWIIGIDWGKGKRTTYQFRVPAEPRQPLPDDDGLDDVPF
jgi:hypothetical protein